MIGFSDEDYTGIILPYSDALVVTLTVANHKIDQILLDNGSSADILYLMAFKQLNIPQERITPVCLTLTGFIGEQVQLFGCIELSIIAGTIPKQTTILVKFQLVDIPSVYNIILGRFALNELQAITSTPHLKMKFLTKGGVGEVRGDQWSVGQCYHLAMKNYRNAPTSRKEYSEEK